MEVYHSIKNKNIAFPKMTKTVSYVDLFCGLGAFHYALDRVRRDDVTYKCVFACDIDSCVRGIYKSNFGIEPHGDINKINYAAMPDFDMLCAGFPCQSFSKAGKKEGFADPDRGNLFFKILEVLDAKRPSTVILENVKNLKTHDSGRTFARISHELTTRGYNVAHAVLDSRYYSSPQSRCRIYIVATKGAAYTFRNVRNPIVPVKSILGPEPPKYIDFSKKYALQPCPQKGMMKYTLVNRATNRGGRQGERVYSIEHCGPTVCAKSGGPGAKTGLYEIKKDCLRTLSVSETLQMFGFPADIKREGISTNKMLYYLGNSIVINVLQEILGDLTWGAA